jgi:protein AaeX
MIKEINLSGIYVAPFAAYLFCALLIYVPLRIWLDRIEIQKWVWHRPLFEVALFLIILSLIGLAFR